MKLKLLLLSLLSFTTSSIFTMQKKEIASVQADLNEAAQDQDLEDFLRQLDREYERSEGKPFVDPSKTAVVKGIVLLGEQRTEIDPLSQNKPEVSQNKPKDN